MLLSHKDRLPRVAPSVFVGAGALIVGDVTVGTESSIWFGTVVRGDVNYVRIGNRTNLQDGCVVHVTRGTHPTEIGDEVTVGHRAVLHGCRIGDRCLIGIGAIVLDGVVVGEQSIVAAGSLLPPGSVYPPGSLIMGSPARVRRPLSSEETEGLQQSATNYVNYAREYLGEQRNEPKG